MEEQQNSNLIASTSRIGETMASLSRPEIPLWVDNEPLFTETKFEVRNSVTGQTVVACAIAPALVKSVVDSSHKAFAEWKESSAWERRELLLRAASLLEERRLEAEQILKVEIPIDDFVARQVNIQASIDLLQELASQVLEVDKGSLLPSRHGKNTFALVINQPVGVQLGVAPWNVSLLLGIRAVATPIACGNTAILKASEITPLVHNFIGILFKDAGFPPGVLNVVQHRKEDAAEVTDALLRDERVRKVNFTGSSAVGKIIAAKAASYGKPSLLELGGKAPQIVLQDADLDKAAEAAASGAFLHHGQICMSTERLIVHSSVVQAFSEKLRGFLASTRIESGAMNSQVHQAQKLIQDALNSGARSLSGEEVTVEGSKMNPIVLVDVKPDMPIWRMESFAPVVVLVPFETMGEAISLANDSDYGLSSSIFTSNVARGIQLARSLEAGAVHINSMTIHDEAHLPHGGVKDSGWGRFGVPWGFAEFTQVKTITITNNGDNEI